MQSGQFMLTQSLHSTKPSAIITKGLKSYHDHNVSAGDQRSVSFYIALDNHKCTHFMKHHKKSFSEKDLSQKYAMHTTRREKIIADRVQRLKARHYQLQYRKMILAHKLKLMRLKLKAKIDYAQSKASIRRQTFLQNNIEKWTARIEYVQNVALIQKFKKMNTLSQVISDSLMSVIDQDSNSTLYVPEMDSENFESDEDDGNLPLLSPKNLYRLLCDDHIAEKAIETKSLDPSKFLDIDELSYMDLLPLLPPINHFSLRELDMVEILSNAQIRHDLVFDPNLKFKPNNEGETGDATKETTIEFWAAFSKELTEGHYYRVPLLLHEVKVILTELLPKNDAITTEITEWVDVTLVSQQLHHGVFNPFSTIEQLGKILLRHCAPIRDKTVLSMVETCKSGDFGACMKQLFDLLELMKLDYANYQMSKIRPFVLEKAVEFEWRWFKDRVDCEIIELDATANWMAAFGTPSEGLTTRDIFLNAFLELVISLPSLTYGDIPETMALDHDRIRSYHSDLQDIGIVSMLQMVMRQILGRHCSNQVLESIKDRQKVLLNDEEATVEHIVVDLKHLVEKTRGSKLTESESSLLYSMVAKSLDSTDNIYCLIINRAKEHIITIINGGNVDEALLQKHGLSFFKNEITELGNKCKQLFVFHWEVYHELYNSIFQG